MQNMEARCRKAYVCVNLDVDKEGASPQHSLFGRGASCKYAGRINNMKTPERALSSKTMGSSCQPTAAYPFADKAKTNKRR